MKHVIFAVGHLPLATFSRSQSLCSILGYTLLKKNAFVSVFYCSGFPRSCPIFTEWDIRVNICEKCKPSFFRLYHRCICLHAKCVHSRFIVLKCTWIVLFSSDEHGENATVCDVVKSRLGSDIHTVFYNSMTFYVSFAK